MSPEGETSRGYREDGYFPEAFVNMLAMLGWNPGDERELFSMDELIEAFSLDKVQKAGAKFNPEKAKWYNKEYLRARSDEALTDLLIPVLSEQGVTVTGCPKCPVSADFEARSFSWNYVRGVVSLVKERATFVQDLYTAAACLFGRPQEYIAKDVEKFWKRDNYEPAFEAASFLASRQMAWEREQIGATLEGYIRERAYPMGKVMNCLRLVLTGASSGLGIADILSFIGKEELLVRIEAAKARLGTAEYVLLWPAPYYGQGRH